MLGWVRRPLPVVLPPLNVGRTVAVHPEAAAEAATGGAISRGEDMALWLAVSIPAAVAGLWIAVGLHMFYIDNVARTYEAYQVLYGFDPKLANLGFIWAPLPAALQIPLVALLPGLAQEGGTGPLVSAMAAGGCLVLLNRILAQHVPGRRYRYLLLALYQTNPLVVYLAVTGMSELLVLLFVLLAWYAFQQLAFDEPLVFSRVVIMGLAMAGAVMSRYEGVGFAMALAAVLAVLLYYELAPRQRALAEGLTILYLTPWTYAFAVWMFLNAMIMGNPFNFVVGKGSASDHAHTLLASNPALATLVGEAMESTTHALHADWDVAPAFLPVFVLALVLTVARRDLFLLSLAVVSASFTAMQGLLYFTGASLGWLRYHVYLAAFAPVLLSYCLRREIIPPLGRIPWPVGMLCSIVFVAWSAQMTWRGLDDRSFVLDNEPAFLTAAFQGGEAAAAFNKGGREIALYFRNELFPVEPQALILADDQQANEVVLFSHHANRFVVSNASVFMDYVRHPVGNVTHILVPERAKIGTDLIIKQYPDIFEEGTPFTTLEHEFDTPGLRWRLYRVVTADGSP